MWAVRATVRVRVWVEGEPARRSSALHALHHLLLPQRHTFCGVQIAHHLPQVVWRGLPPHHHRLLARFKQDRHGLRRPAAGQCCTQLGRGLTKGRTSRTTAQTLKVPPSTTHSFRTPCPGAHLPRGELASTVSPRAGVGLTAGEAAGASSVIRTPSSCDSF